MLAGMKVTLSGTRRQRLTAEGAPCRRSGRTGQLRPAKLKLPKLVGLTIPHVQDDSSGHIWREEMAKRSPLAHDAQALGRLIEQDHDPSEVAYYEAFADPDEQALDDAQRSYAGQYLRRLRRLDEQRKHARSDREH
ncbi:hypothetical protein V6U77_02230 [Micromonospora sp. CPCC 205546]|uniref:hypothetical protein n=1 Tax=Micromonospora sp. CPCC 205546 TaxID=3122397 RepID=UPI002FF1417C